MLNLALALAGRRTETIASFVLSARDLPGTSTRPIHGVRGLGPTRFQRLDDNVKLDTANSR
jgi:hypothetical protein